MHPLGESYVPMLYVHSGTMKDSYRRECLNLTVLSLRKATLANCFRRATYSTTTDSNPNLRDIYHFSSVQSAFRLILVPSVCYMLMVRDHSTKYSGAVHSISSRNMRDELMKSVSSAYSMSCGKAESAVGRVVDSPWRSRCELSGWLMRRISADTTVWQVQTIAYIQSHIRIVLQAVCVLLDNVLNLKYFDCKLMSLCPLKHGHLHVTEQTACQLLVTLQ